LKTILLVILLGVILALAVITISGKTQQYKNNKAAPDFIQSKFDEIEKRNKQLDELEKVIRQNEERITTLTECLQFIPNESCPWTFDASKNCRRLIYQVDMMERFTDEIHMADEPFPLYHVLNTRQSKIIRASDSLSSSVIQGKYDAVIAGCANKN
jgi:seryl-tRNA synthetase